MKQLWMALAALVTLSGCQPPQPLAATPQAPAKAASTVLAGVARAPVGITGVIANNGAAIVPTGGGNVVPTGGGNIVPTGGGNLRLQAFSEAPLANATVFLGDSAGQPYPLVAAVQTDAQGRFSFPDVPVGVTVMVVALGRDEARHADATLQTLARTSDLGATATVDTASTLVTLAVVQEQQSDLGSFDAATFRTATEATARQLASQAAPDLTDRAALRAQVAALSNDVLELKSALDALRQEIKDLKASLADIKARLGQPKPPATGPNGGPGICALPVAHEFALSSQYAGYPLKLEVVAPHGAVVFTMAFQKPGATATLAYPAICPNTLVLYDANGVELARKAGWSLAMDAAYHVDLPL
ncbi:MAG: hypothetical protein JWM80_5824 [Cyanobacteria bacterium RYN_339]|nr:hypothetical protein [Cyanobacteria bacterium RYN_339]